RPNQGRCKSGRLVPAAPGFGQSRGRLLRGRCCYCCVAGANHERKQSLWLEPLACDKLATGPLMRLVRRLIAWSCFICLLTAVGAGVYHFVRYRPRCTIEGPIVVRHLSPDGRWLVGEAMSKPPPDDSRAAEVLCLRVFDAQSGRLVRSLPALGHDCIQSPDGRPFVLQPPPARR